MKKIFTAFLACFIFLILSCESSKKTEEVVVLYDFVLSLFSDEDPYTDRDRNFTLRDISGEYSVELTEEGEEIVTGIYPLVLLDDNYSDKYTAALEEGEYRLYEDEEDLHFFISVGPDRTEASLVECSSIDMAAKTLRTMEAPSALGLVVKERSYQVLGNENQIQRALSNNKSPVYLDMRGCVNTSLVARAFYSCPNLRTIRLPESVTSLGKDVFNGCTSLRYANIPSRTSSIEDGAFVACSNLVELELSEKNTYYIEENGAIYGDGGSSLVAWPAASGEISVPENVDTLKGGCFAGCKNLVSVDLLGAFEIQSGAFQDCVSLKHLGLPQMLMTVETGALDGCTDLSFIEIADGNGSFKANGGILLDSSGKKLLAWPNAQGTVKIPEGITRIEDNAFQKQKGLVSVSLSSTVKEIGSLAFTSCVDLTTVNLSNVNTIESYAFSKCQKLNNVNIPESVKRCDGSAFADCVALTNISVSPKNAQYMSQEGVIYSKDGKTLIEWPAASGSIVIAPGVEEIGTYAFNACSSLKSVSMENVRVVGHHAFDSCKSLESVDLGSKVVSIGSHAFSNCMNIKELYIPESVSIIKNYAFWFWGSNQTLNCQIKNKPAGWDFAWNADSEAKLNWNVAKILDSDSE